MNRDIILSFGESRDIEDGVADIEKHFRGLTHVSLHFQIQMFGKGSSGLSWSHGDFIFKLNIIFFGSRKNDLTRSGVLLVVEHNQRLKVKSMTHRDDLATGVKINVCNGIRDGNAVVELPVVDVGHLRCIMS